MTDLSTLDFDANAALRIEGTRNLVNSACAHGVDKLIAQSTSWAYEPGSSPALENEPLARIPDSAESAFPSINALESAVSEMPHGTALRYGILYGPGTCYAPGGVQYENARRGQVQATTAWTSFVHVDDAVAATVQALDWPAGPVNIVDDEPTHVDEWGPLFAQSCGHTGTLDLSARSVGRAAGNQYAQSLGWRPNHSSWRAGPFE